MAQAAACRFPQVVEVRYVPEDADYLEFGSGLRLPLAELIWSYSRSSGPGGQNVNKVSTKARMEWPVAENSSLPEAVRERFLARYASQINSRGMLVLASQRTRSQQQNRHDLLERLRQMLEEVAEAPARRRRTRHSRASRARRLAEKRRRSQTKQTRRPVRQED